MVRTSNFESAGPSSIPDEGNRRTAQPAVHPSKTGWSINGYIGKVNYGNSDVTVAVTDYFPTTGSKANVTGDEGPQLRAATGYAPTLPYLTSNTTDVITNTVY